MKRLVFLLSCLLCTTMILPTQAAMTQSEIREHARFISDRMGYELQLTNSQYNDVYEINYDFLTSIRYLVDNLAYGYDSDIDQYYNYLDLRNEDLSYVLNRTQYVLFMSKEYFYTPLYLNNSRCTFRIYSVYTNRSIFYFSLPVNFYSYAGIHNRNHYRNGFYTGRYSHARYQGTGRSIRSDRERYATHRQKDFKVQAPKSDRGNNVNSNRYRPTNQNNNRQSQGSSTRPNTSNRNDNRKNNQSSVQNNNRNERSNGNRNNSDVQNNTHRNNRMNSTSNNTTNVQSKSNNDRQSGNRSERNSNKTNMNDNNSKSKSEHKSESRSSSRR